MQRLEHSSGEPAPRGADMSREQRHLPVHRLIGATRNEVTRRLRKADAGQLARMLEDLDALLTAEWWRLNRAAWSKDAPYEDPRTSYLLERMKKLEDVLRELLHFQTQTADRRAERRPA